MEEIPSWRRINSEGHGMSGAKQEYDMNSKQLLTGLAVAGVLGLASPVFAAHLGGAGSFGGGLGGNLGSFGGSSRLGGTGGFDSQGSLKGSTSSVNTKPVAKTAAKADGAATGTANKAEGTVNGTANKAEGTATGTATTASAAPAPAAKSPATGAAPAKATPGESANLTGGTDQTVTAGSRTVSGGANGALAAQRTGGSASEAAAGTANGSLN